jgi:hypothetical protein
VGIKKKKTCKTKIKGTKKKNKTKRKKKEKQNCAGFEQYHCHGMLIKYS